MNPIRRVRRLAAIVAGLAGALLAVTAAPAAFAMTVPAGGGGAGPAGPPARTVIHTVVAGGMPGWQIALIAAGAALLTAGVAVVLDRARAAHRKTITAAA
jgi:hypothetical protein